MLNNHVVQKLRHWHAGRHQAASVVVVLVLLKAAVVLRLQAQQIRRGRVARTVGRLVGRDIVQLVAAARLLMLAVERVVRERR